MKTYSEALIFLNSLINYEKTGFNSLGKNVDLDKLREVLKRSSNPQKNYRSIQVAGTKGKGSICTFVASILKEAGFSVGLFTSPHLVDARERVMVDDHLITKKELVHVLECLCEYLGPDPEKKFTFFEVYTLMAIMHFSIKKVDFAVFETGMGGRLDATNIIDAEVCGISPVSFDHMEVLGGTLEKIAKEKAAIVKKGSRCVSSPQKISVLDVVRERCGAEKTSLSVVGEDITYKIGNLDKDGSCFDVCGEKGYYRGCHTQMIGSFQPSNCAAAIGICENILEDEDIGNAVKRGIETAYIPGRLEVLTCRPMIVIDGAQNADSAGELRASVETVFKYDRLILLLGVSRDKDLKGICRNLEPLADEIVLTRASVGRAADPHLIRGHMRRRNIKITENIKEGLGMALHFAGKNDMILATGSFFVIGEVREMILGDKKSKFGSRNSKKQVFGDNL